MPQKLSEALRSSIASYIAENFIDEQFMTLCLEMPVMEEAAEDLTIGSYAEERRCASPKALSLEELLRQEDAGFTETLLRRIDKTGKKDSEIYKKANISKQHFSKIRGNLRYRPTKQTALALALALELSLEDTQDLIGRAGYTLSYSSKFDLIVRYFIEKGNYNITELNIALYEFDQPLLGV